MASRDKPASSDLKHQVIAGLERLGSALRAQAWSEAFERGLTPTQGQVLSTLRARRAALRLSEVADALGVKPATASDAVQSLVDKGLVKKTQAASDARAIQLSLTKKGEQEAEAVAAWPTFLLDAVDVLPLVAQGELLKSVLTIISSLQQRGHISVARMCVNCENFRAHAHPGQSKPHHCELLGAPLGDPELRADCAEHELARDARRLANWQLFAGETAKPKRRLPVG